jgi:stage II sporulation protein D
MHVLALTPGEGLVTVTGRGWGHGVGMCQVGCREMARKGLTEAEILRYYYPAADFTRIY